MKHILFYVVLTTMSYKWPYYMRHLLKIQKRFGILMMIEYSTCLILMLIIFVIYVAILAFGRSFWSVIFMLLSWQCVVSPFGLGTFMPNIIK